MLTGYVCNVGFEPITDGSYRYILKYLIEAGIVVALNEANLTLPNKYLLI
jgi:hypothetical protein